MIIDKAENNGFHIAGLGTHKKQVQASALRDSFRLMTDDEQTASIFFERKSFLFDNIKLNFL